MKNVRMQYPLVFALAAALVAAVFFQLVPEQLMPQEGIGVATLLRSLAPAVILLVLYLFSGGWLLDRRTTQYRRTESGESSAVVEEFVDPYSRLGGNNAPGVFPTKGVLAGVLLAAVVLGVARVLVQKSPLAVLPIPGLLFIGVMLATAILEEILFRGLLFEAFAKTLRERSPESSLLLAAIVSSVLFGILHITSDVGSLFRATAFVQAGVKVAEGMLFGLVMCALYTYTRSVWPAILVHFVFNVISELPIFLATGAMTTTYITGSPADIAVLAIGTAILVLPAKWAYSYLKG